MNYYKKRFNNIAEKIGEEESGEGKKIEGIDRIYHASDGYLSIRAKKIEILRGCGGDLYHIKFEGIDRWSLLEDLSERLERWFSYVESKIDAHILLTNVPKEVKVDGRRYKLVE